jgi:hypothetical protein
MLYNTSIWEPEQRRVTAPVLPKCSGSAILPIELSDLGMVILTISLKFENWFFSILQVRFRKLLSKKQNEETKSELSKKLSEGENILHLFMYYCHRPKGTSHGKINSFFYIYPTASQAYNSCEDLFPIFFQTQIFENHWQINPIGVKIWFFTTADNSKTNDTAISFSLFIYLLCPEQAVWKYMYCRPLFEDIR